MTPLMRLAQVKGGRKSRGQPRHRSCRATMRPLVSCWATILECSSIFRAPIVYLCQSNTSTLPALTAPNRQSSVSGSSTRSARKASRSSSNPCVRAAGSSNTQSSANESLLTQPREYIVSTVPRIALDVLLCRSAAMPELSPVGGRGNSCSCRHNERNNALPTTVACRAAPPSATAAVVLIMGRREHVRVHR